MTHNAPNHRGPNERRTMTEQTNNEVSGALDCSTAISYEWLSDQFPCDPDSGNWKLWSNDWLTIEIEDSQPTAGRRGFFVWAIHTNEVPLKIREVVTTDDVLQVCQAMCALP